MVGFVSYCQPQTNFISTVNEQKPALEMTVFCCKECLYYFIFCHLVKHSKILSGCSLSSRNGPYKIILVLRSHGVIYNTLKKSFTWIRGKNICSICCLCGVNMHRNRKNACTFINLAYTFMQSDL